MHPLSQTVTTSTWLNTSAISRLRMQHKQQEWGQHPQSPPLQLGLAATQSQLPWLDASTVSLAQNPTSASRTRKTSSVSPSPTQSHSYSSSTSTCTWLKQLAWPFISSASNANSPALSTRSVNQVNFHHCHRYVFNSSILSSSPLFVHVHPNFILRPGLIVPHHYCNYNIVQLILHTIFLSKA